jgi:hypothetical protein
MCTADVFKCPDGTEVGRDSTHPNCPFFECPKSCPCGEPCMTKKGDDGLC